MSRFDGKTVFITGGARGQAGRMRLRLPVKGNVVVSDLADAVRGVPREELEETVAEIEKLDRRVLAIVADVRDQQALNDAAAAAISEFGQIVVLVANAGILTMQYPGDERRDLGRHARHQPLRGLAHPTSGRAVTWCSSVQGHRASRIRQRRRGGAGHGPLRRGKAWRTRPHEDSGLRTRAEPNPGQRHRPRIRRHPR